MQPLDAEAGDDYSMLLLKPSLNYKGRLKITAHQAERNPPGRAMQIAEPPAQL